MSFTPVHEPRRARHTCQSCQDRKARFSYRGAVKADRDHTLCFECFRRERERQRARWLADKPESSTHAVTVPGRAGVRLTGQQAEHRRAMLANLSRQALALTR